MRADHCAPLRAGARPMPRRLLFLLMAGMPMTFAAALAADPEPFLAGATKSCIECDLAGRALMQRDFQRARLDRANLAAADLSGSSLFRATLTRAHLKGAKLIKANLNLIDAKGADLEGADLTQALLFEADFSGANLAGAYLRAT